jgi:hypothetical protein
MVLSTSSREITLLIVSILRTRLSVAQDLKLLADLDSLATWGVYLIASQNRLI